MAKVLRTGVAVHGLEGVIERTDGSRVDIMMHIDPVHDDNGEVIGAINCFHDISASKHAEQTLREQDQRLAATYEHAAMAISEVDANGRLLRVNETACTITGYTREELLQRTIFEVTHPDDLTDDRFAFREQTIRPDDRYTVEKRLLRKDGTVIWVSVASSSVFDTAGSFLYGIRVMRDITGRKRAEERQKVLIDELNHRVKNTLATVQSLATQSLRDTHGGDIFLARLFALSRAHDQLSRAGWEWADFRTIVDDIFAPYQIEGSPRLSLTGGSVRLPSQAALVLAMVMHELATNAAKYGSLSVPEGIIAVTWSVQEGSDGRRLAVTWQESGGPQVRKPRRRGFGSRLTERAITRELNGSVQISFDPAGLRCTFEIPLMTPSVPS
jgi:PAS domain S-box-containing protein